MSKIKIKIKQKKLIILSLVLFLISAFVYFQFRPIIKSIASSRARVIATEIVNEAILQELSENKDDYENIVKIQKNDSGELTVLLSDMEKINKLKNHENPDGWIVVAAKNIALNAIRKHNTQLKHTSAEEIIDIPVEDNVFESALYNIWLKDGVIEKLLDKL